jgi:DNA-binding CsgD family transcriptional regulator
MARLPRSSASDNDEVGPQSLGEENPFALSDLAESASAQTPQTRAAPPPATGDQLSSHNRNASLRGEATPSDVLVALTYGLDLVQHGAMLVAAEGLPRLANSVAMTVLQKRDGLWLEKTGLVTDRATDTRLLRKLLQDAIQKPEAGEPKESPITLQRKTAHSALIVRVVPGPGLKCWPGTENRTALLKLYDQDLGLQVDAGDLCRLYGLTRGEAALAVLLVQGKSIDDAAAELFISPHTARTHLKRIFMKTDTHRQTELAVRILTVVL